MCATVERAIALRTGGYRQTELRLRFERGDESSMGRAQLETVTLSFRHARTAAISPPVGSAPDSLIRRGTRQFEAL